MLSLRHLIWDTWNVSHIARHQVTPDEEICHGERMVQQGQGDRLLLIGLTRAGRMLAVVLDEAEDEGDYHVVTARSADSKERRLYRTERGEVHG